MITVFAQTDIGKVRRGNEDHFLVGNLTSEHIEALSHPQDFPLDENGLVLMVSDGMGGAAAGEVASALAVKTVKEYLSQEVFDESSPAPAAVPLGQRLGEALQAANHTIIENARHQPALQGMGATATLAGILGGQAFIAQIGDSRAYLLRQGRIWQLTRDQSFVNQLVETGRITEEEAEVHPRRNIILQALGAEEQLKVALSAVKLRRDDYLLLCTDGLSGVLKKQDLAQIVFSAPDPASACQELIREANRRGGPDNITVVLANFRGAEFVPPREAEEPAIEIISEFSESE